ncbi:MAG: putative sugar nucleotidyl transferase [Phycisphaeraceae bacterium]
MQMAKLLIFDDGRGRWGPMTDRRPVFDLRTGALTTRARIERVLGRPAAALRVSERLAAVCREREAGSGETDGDPTGNAGGRDARPTVNGELAAGPWLLVNGRWNAVLHGDLVGQLAVGRALVEADGDLVAVCLEAAQATALLAAGDGRLPADVTRTELPDRVLLGRPWHVLDELPATLEADLRAMALPELDRAAHPGVHVIGNHPVRLGEHARVLPGVVLNAEAGPVVIDAHALVHPFTMIEGPVYVGRHTTLAAHTALRPNTVIGPHCKVGGEVSAAIVHGHTNKAHAGYLGAALVGQWCNLGADTNVSNLKNTYGPVRVQLTPDSEPEDTGRVFHGPIVGDFVRTAIGSRLLTGSVIGTGCMLATAGFAPKHLPAFAFHTDQSSLPHDIDRLLQTVQRMLARRDQTLSAAEADLFRTLHTVRTTAPV